MADPQLVQEFLQQRPVTKERAEALLVVGHYSNRGKSAR
jgi:hypothetical protein